MSEWRELKTLKEVVDAQEAGDKIEVQDNGTIWCPWSGKMWNELLKYRARVKDPYAELKKAAADPTKQVRLKEGAWLDSGYYWGWNYPVEKYEIRDKPKTRKVKMLAWLVTYGQLIWWDKEAPTPDGWKRVPSEDKEIEVME